MSKKRSKRYRQLRENTDRMKRYELGEALDKVFELSNAKFDESIDVSFNLGVNPKHADQMVRGAITLPHGTGKSARVVVFAKGDKAKEAEDAGADFVGSDDLVKKITDGWLDFDKAIATPDMMGQVGRLGKVLGPRGLMPNPKLGTVTFEVKKAVEEQKKGRVEYRTEKTGIVHCPFGKKSIGKEKLIDNFGALYSALIKAKPATSKGVYMRKITLNSTMSPGVMVDPSGLKADN